MSRPVHMIGIPARWRRWSAMGALAMLAWGCGAERPEHHATATAGDGQGIASWFAGLFRSRPEPIVDCAGLGAWLSAHGSSLIAKAERTGFIAELQYRPAACLACMEDRTAAFADEGFRARVAELKGAELYVLRISEGTDPSDDAPYLELSESLRGDLVEVIGTDTLECVFLHVEAMPSMVPYTSALIGFDRPQDGRDRRIVLLDRADRFGGDVVFEFGGLGRYTAVVPDSLISGRS